MRALLEPNSQMRLEMLLFLYSCEIMTCNKLDGASRQYSGNSSMEFYSKYILHLY